MSKGRLCTRLSVLIISVLLVFTVSYSQVFAEEQCQGGGDHEYTITVVRHATSDADGLRRYVCDKCGYTYTETIPATGHRWGSWSVIRKATASAEGLKHRVCMNDTSHVEYDPISVLPGSTDNTIGGGTIVIDNGGQVKSQTVAKTRDSNRNKTEDGSKDGGDSRGGKGSGGYSAKTVPLGAADVAIVGANGAASIFFILLLLPLIKVMFWIAKKRREAEEDQ